MYFNRKNAEQKNWRMIKKGKHFLFGCSLVFAVGATLATPAVHADTAEAKAETTTLATQAEPTTETPSYVAPAATSPVATEAVEANSATTVVSADKSQLEAVLAQAKAKNLDGQEASVKAEVAAAIAEAEALVANGSASQEQVNQSVERLTQAVSSVKEVTEVAAETAPAATTESSATPKVRSRRATSEGTSRAVDESRLDRVTVTKDNFDSFFKEGGTASYDETSGTIKLTDDVGGQVGSAYLRFKIDPKEDFTFTGKVDIGDKYEGHQVNGRDGGDGVGFVFHTGNVDTIGQSGASIGMGTIKNAFGFKLDSWHNTTTPNASNNAPADPKYGGNAWRSNAFGAFYSSNAAGRVATVGDAKALNPKPNGQWVDFKIEYKGQTKEFIVTYGYEKWSTNLKTANASILAPTAKTALNNSNATYALSFLGSTGSGTNLQRVQIEKFEFTAPQIVQVAFYDEAGNELAASSAIPGDRDQVVNLNNIEAVQKAISKIKAKGYTLKEVNKQKAETYNAAANTVTLRQGGQLLKYIFAVPSPAITPTLQATGSMTVAGVKSTDNTLSGTGVPGATVTVKVAGTTLADNITVATDGTWTTTLSKGFNSNITNQDQLVPKDSVTIIQKIGVSESEATEVAVGLGESTVQPSTDSKDQQSIVAETTTVTLKVPHDAGIAYFDYPNANNGRSEVAIKRDSIPGAWTSKDESKAVVTSYSSGGFFDTIVLEMKEKIQPGKAKVISNIKENNYSSPVDWKEINVEAKPDTTPPVAPTVNPVKAGATAITGTAEAGSTVEVTLPNGQKASAKAGDNGEFSITVPALSVDDQISVTATDAANNKSDATTVTVKENVRPVVTIPYDDKANQIIYVYSGEENNIELKITDNSGKISKAYLVFAQDNRTGLGTEDAGYLNGKTKSALYLKANRFGSETTATEANPAIIKLTANIPNGSYTYGTGMTRYIYAEDLAGNTNYDNVGAAGDTGAPGRIRFVWKPQTFKYNAQAPSTPITSNTVPEASAIEKAVKDANPTFSDKIGSVTLDGTNVKVTYKDGSTDTLSADSVFTIKPTAPTVTPVKNPSSLEQPEKDAVKKAVEDANPTATKVEVGNDGSATVTFPDGTTATLTGDKTVKEADSKGVQEPAAKTPVQNTSALTQPEKDAVKKAVEDANPTATKVEVGNDGSATVTFPDGTTATLTGDKTVKEADSKGVQEPAAKTPVQNTSALTQPEKDAVKKAVEDANPTATKVEVGNDGSATVTFPDGTTATLTGDKTVKEADSKGVQEPAAKTPVQNTSALTQPEKDAVKKAVEDANPTATKVEVGNDGSATVTFPDGTTATLTGDKTVKEADSKGVQEPAAKTPVQNTSALTQPEKDAVKKAVEDANPTATKVEVGNDGSATVTFPDGTTATLTGDKTVKEADSKGVQEPAAKTPVQNTSALTQPEKDAVKKAVEDANPTATKVEVGNDGSATVTFPDGTTATLTGDKTVKEADSKGVQEPAAKTPVQNTSALTQPEKDAVKKAVEDANPTATKVEVGNDGSATVTFPDGTTATLTGDKTVKEADSKGVQEPAAKTPVQNTSALTQPEKDAVKKAVEDANPTATKVEVGNDGSATVTFPDGTTATLTGDKTVKEADSKGVQEPAAKTPVQNTSALTQPEKDAVKKAVEDANPTATKVEVGNDGSATVTFPDGTTATLTGDKTVKEADSKGVQEPAAKTPVQNTSALTQPEKDAVKKAVEDANPTATKVEVGNDGSATVTFPDGTTATLTGDKTVKEADDKTAPDAPVVNPVKAGDTAVTGTAEAGSTVEVTLPDGTKASATADQDGNFSVPVSGLEEGQTVSVTAKDASNNTSTPTTATVAKADDKTAPDAPVVNPVKAGDTAVTGTAEAGSTVEVTLPDGTKASATADQDGNFSVPVSGLEEGQTVSVTAKDASNNTSTPTTTTVAKADDKTAPDAPVVNPVKAGDTAVTGTAEAGSTVEVTLPDGTKASATADQDGNFSVPVSGLEEGQTVSVTAKDASNNTSTPTTATVAKADDKTAPDAPVVNPVKAGDTAVTGTAEAGSTVEVTLPDGTKASATADQDGNFSVPVSGLEEGQTVSVTAKDASNNTSTPTTATVAKADDKTAPDAPVVNPVKAGDTAVTGTAEAGSTVEVTLPDGTKASATADQDGNFSVPVSGLEEGQTVSVTAKDASNNTSTPTTATVAKADDKTAPDAPVVNPVKAGDTAVTGTAEAGSTVEVTLPDGTKASATADQDGNFSVPVSGLEEGQTVSVTAKDASNNTSTPTTATVAKADDKTAPDAPVVNPVKAGDTAVTGTAEAGSTVEVTLPDGTKASATADQDGNFSVPVSGLEEGQTVSVTAKDASNNTSTPTTTTVAKADDKTAPDAPVVNPVKAGDTAVTGTAEAGSTVEVTLPDGTKASATADQDGNFSVPVSGLEEGQTVSVTAKDASNNTSTPTTTTVAKADDKTAPDAPVVNPVKAGDTAVTGTAEAGSTVEVTLPDGTKASATADQDGNFSVPVSGLEEGQTVSVTAKDASNNTSTPTTATVAKADDKTAPDAPVVNPVKAGDTAVTGTAEAGSTVEVTLPDGTKASATADQDGNFSVPVSGLEEGQTVSVTAKDASNNTSTPTTTTVAKADDKTAPDAPVVNPVKAGDTAVTGTAEAGSTVEVTLPDGTKASATADQDGNFSVPVSGLEEGQTVSVTAKDASNNTSTPTTATVAKADDKTAPDAPVVNPVKEGDKAVTGTAEPGLIVEITLPNSETVTVATNEAGIFYLPVMGLKAGDKVTAVAKDASGNASTPTEKTVGKRDVKDADGIQAPTTKTPVKDTANLTDAEKAKVKEAVEAANPGSKAEVGQDGTTTVTFPDGSTATLTGAQTVKEADSKGVQAPSTKTPVKDTANLTDAEKAKVKEAVEAANPGSKAEVGQDGTTTVTFPDGSTATLTGDKTVTQADITAPTAPVVNPVKAGDEAITGKAEPGSTVEVTLPDGTKATATADQDGNFSIPVSGLNENDEVSVTATDAAKNTSTPTTATVAKADDKTAPDAPVVNPVKAGDEAITGKAEPGSTVEVTLPGGAKKSATAGEDGTFSIPVSGLKAGDKVTAVAKDASGNTSTPTEKTVGKGDGKDADNVKVPALTPVVDPNNLTDAEKAKVAEEVKKANPTATDVKVNNDGSVVVTFADGSVATIAANKVVKEATKESSAQAPSKKAGAKELPNTGTKQSNASLGLALLAAVTGGLLISKKRKEEE